MASTKPRNTIESTIGDWPGIKLESHDRGGREFTLNGREIGHIHGDRLVDIPFTKHIRDIFLTEEQAQKHHVLPDSGWTSYYIRSDEDVGGALWLLRISYLYHLIAMQKRTGNHAGEYAVDIDVALDELNLSNELRRVFSEMRVDT